MRKYFTFISSVLVALLFLSIAALGQRTTGDIEGTVTDPQGAVVPNVTVTVVSAQSTGGGSEVSVTSGFKRTVQADSEGFYRVQQVPPGSYLVTTDAISGFGGARLPNVRVALDNTTYANIQLTASGSTATVDINSNDAPAIDQGGSKIQTNITSQKIDLLPKGVEFTSILKTVPGTRAEANSGGFTVDGASGSENAFYIDGQEVTNFRTGTLNANNNIPTQFVQEVQVKSSGFEAEFGGATGGVISVVTKGGSNEWRGEFGAMFNSQKLNGNPRPSLLFFSTDNAAEYFSLPKVGGVTFYPTANLGGPIIKDKVWFFTSYSPTIITQNTTTTYYTNRISSVRTVTAQETFDFKRKQEYAFARLDANPTNNLRLSGTFLWNPIIDQGNIPQGTAAFGALPLVSIINGTTYRGREIADRQGGRQNANNVTGQAIWTPTSDLVVTGRFSRGFLNERLASYFIPTAGRYRCIEVTAATVPVAPCSAGFADAANSVNNKDISIRTNYEADASYLLGGLGGRHEFKGGYQRFKILNDVDRGYADTGIFDFYYGRAIDTYLGFPVDPSCISSAGVFGACTRNTAGTVTNRAPFCAAGQTTGCILGSGELIRFSTQGRGENLNQSVYIQDRWQPFSRLTLNLGVRFEKEDLPSYNGTAPPINFGWKDKISPRVGFALDVTGDGRTKAFASYGRFYDRLKFELPRGSFGGDFYRIDAFEIFPGQNFRSFTIANILGSFNDAPGGICNQTGFIGTGARSRCQFDYRIASNDPNATIFTGAVDPDLEPFRQTEFTAGVERQMSRDFVVKGRYTYKNVDQAIEDAGILTAQGSEAYIIGNPGQGLHAELLRTLGYQKAATPQRRYDAFEIQLDKRLSNSYYFNVNYTLSRLYGNYSGLASSDEAGRTSPGVNRFFDLPFLGFTAAGNPDNGRLNTDRPHIVNAYGAYILDWSSTNSTEFSGFTTIQSGTPVTTVVPFLISATAGSPIFTARGDLGRTEKLTQTDFAVSHKYRFGRDSRFTMAADLNILNLFDEKNVLGIYSNPIRSTLGLGSVGFGGGSPVDIINRYNSGSLLSAINALIPTSNPDPRYRQANSFQGPRSIRFGFRLLF